MKSIVSEKGQVTIPKALRDRLGIRPGTELDFEAERGRLVGRKVVSNDPVESLYGILRDEGSTDEVMDRLRGKPEGV
jgi:antitoxin PrlF